jgi:hypothetical protein
MFQKLVFIAVSMCIVWSCAGPNAPKMSPEAYNDYIVGEQVAVLTHMLEVNSLLAENPEQAKLKLSEGIQRIQEGIENLKKLEPFNGNTEFRDAAIALFEFYDEAFSNDYNELLTLLIKLNTEGIENEAELNRVFEIPMQIEERERAFDEQFNLAQQQFITRNKIILQQNPLQNALEKQ